MLLIIAPAKKLDFGKPAPVSEYSQPQLLERSAELVRIMQEKDSFEIADLMRLSMKLADLNARRFQQWHAPFTPDNAKQAIFAFAGDVFQTLDAATLTADDLAFAQQHLRILSGLYGVLRPLDLMQAYRLEMGTKLAGEHGRNLYDFWGETITDTINKDLTTQGDHILVNLASNEYFSSIRPDNINGRIITPVFKEFRKGSYRIISFNAKRARGLMSRFIIRNRINDPEQIKHFDLADYAYKPELSSDNEWHFCR